MSEQTFVFGSFMIASWAMLCLVYTRFSLMFNIGCGGYYNVHAVDGVAYE